MSQNKYPLISRFLPELIMNKSISFGDVFRASDLEAELAKGVEVYGDDMSRADHVWSDRKEQRDKYTALLIGLKPIESQEPVSKSEIVELMNKMAGHIELIGLEMTPLYNDLKSRIEKHGVKND